jgi:hypothetical protein
MAPLEAKRTLVKSTPELWDEVSDLAALARHLGEFGEIRITRTEPQSVVEWEGDRASGAVRLERSGWGTKVTLSAVPAAVEQPPKARLFARWRRQEAPAAEAADAERTLSVLRSALDRLGSAHHRPFSR